ncbi:DUF262 domain-containing protein [Sphingobacterium lumbrici]|uniref:DUF262 domain-containing protein n=1 Tax=Sphingobacterium lumbrici TaxID=2559600 RepID=UPI00112E1802|nr:DUF262 domain-containing protein [Sphingobacterium lumbrici]
MSHQVQTFNIKELFNSGKYRIPIYQRNYAWGRSEILQLIQDIVDYIPEKTNYYIGTLVVYPQKINEETVYDAIDGQQRLTTLSIMLSVLKNKFKEVEWFDKQILNFESRPLSQNAMSFAKAGYFDGHKEYHSTIKEAYDSIEIELETKLAESGLSINQFALFLENYVTILRVEVPHDTDLNHYFEIMNNRGEQLEKHEVVKSMLLDTLYDEKDEGNEQLQELFHIIWDAVQNMERYVQFGFEPALRKSLFGIDWSTLLIKDSETLIEAFLDFNDQKDAGDEHFKMNIAEILDHNQVFSNEENIFEISERFTSPINFQNFLLHILKIQTENSNVSLDDKKLIDFFKQTIRSKTKEKAKQFVLDFMFNLLRGKWLMDSYVIKRQFVADKEGWSLLKLKSNDGKKGYYVNTFGKDENWDNEYIVMLLSMFHVSTPTMIYKHWLNAALFHLMNTEEVDFEDYQLYLEKIAKQLICFRFLNTEKESNLEYNQLIYHAEEVNEDYPMINYDNPLLNYKRIENNLVFNFLDYVLWNELDVGDEGVDFEFTFRSSVEHYFPQNPIGGRPLEDKEALHSFGNLCLISHQKNSKLNHHLPSAKKNYYSKLNSKTGLAYDTIKQYIMMNEYDADTWDEMSIEDHHKKMVDKLNDFIQN